MLQMDSQKRLEEIKKENKPVMVRIPKGSVIPEAPWEREWRETEELYLRRPRNSDKVDKTVDKYDKV